MTEILDREPIAPPTERARSRRRRTGWVRLVVAFLAGALFVSVLGYLIDDQVNQHRQFQRTRSALGHTRRRTEMVKHDLAVLVHDVALLEVQVGRDSTTWQQDEAELQAASMALALTQGAVSRQSSLIGPLHTCLGGVQQALNALAIDNQAGAVAALNSVSASCSAASG